MTDAATIAAGLTAAQVTQAEQAIKRLHVIFAGWRLAIQTGHKCLTCFGRGGWNTCDGAGGRTVCEECNGTGEGFSPEQAVTAICATPLGLAVLAHLDKQETTA